MKNKNLDFHNTIFPGERSQIKACPLTRDWENINHAIKPGCIKWKIQEENIDRSPEEDLSKDDTPPLVSDSDFSGSDSEDSSSDSEDDLPSSNARIKSTTSLPGRKTSSVAQSIHRCAVSIDPPYTCPVPGCPKSSCKPWKTPASLHSHIADHALGKLKGTIPPEYFRTWNKKFCSSCYQI